jgi:flagellar basal-body rod protein FlgG
MKTVERAEDAADIPRGAIKNRDLYPLDGRDQAFVVVDGTHTNYRQGNLRVTNSPLDVAIDGPGFLEVSTPNGSRFTRQGSLKMAMDGRLVTSEGYPVLASQPGGLAAANSATTLGKNDQLGQGRLPASAGDQGGSAAARFINLRDRGSNISITAAGEIYAGGDLVAKLNVVEFADLKKIRKIGSNLYESEDAANVIAPQKTELRQGVLETSNVNPVEEMTNLIKANRLFEADLKAMKTYGELLGREANDIGKL